MSIALALICFFISYLLFKDTLEKRKKVEKIKYYKKFKFLFPKTCSPKEARVYIEKLLEYEIPELPEQHQFAFVLARLRNIGFPEGMLLGYKDEFIPI
ncbi:MAG: hypothetical protein PHF86_12570 [Candidatus Nanoarchaeia archaeon]|jgi:hypothetical protein|nr:hypothetical protein [Candidatus Nanoarchaeia archaeon]